jgi:glycosyltransferase involved in cell wall biosynthesis
MRHKKLFVYNDSDIVGGHEILTAQIVNILADHHKLDIHFAYYCDDLTKYISKKITTSRLPFHSKSLNLYNLLFRDIKLVRKLVLELKPDLALISQGFIESGVRGLIACKLAGVRTGSYIPFGNTNRELGNKLAVLRDIVSAPIFALNQFYITVSAYQSRSLERLLSGQPRYVINNPVAVRSTIPKPPVIVVPDGSRPLNIAVVGRILFKQKNQNTLVPVATRLAANGFIVHFHVVGDGPDRAALEALVAAADCQEQFSFHGWMSKERLAEFMERDVDLLLVPSHYEGLPLIFLEAINLGKPVLISRMPFISDYPIPECYIVDADSDASIASKIQMFPLADNFAHMLELQAFVEATNGFERFSRDIEICFESLFVISGTSE